MYDSDSILNAGNEVLGHLDELLGADADITRREILALLQRAAAGEDVADLLLGVLSSRESLREWTLNFLQKQGKDATKLYTQKTPEEKFIRVPVYYGTDRKRTSSTLPAEIYGAERSDQPELGICEVTIPTDHRLADLEAPSFWRLEFRMNPAKHVMVQRVQPLNDVEFFSSLSRDVAASRSRQALVFVHGFNVTFEDAARRTGQIAYDLQFDGPAILYSWPSRGQLSLASYRHDAANIRFTAPHLRSFLESIAQRSGAAAIHLIAHSMGNQALTEALHDIAATVHAGTELPISEVILTAADIDSDVFRQMAEQFHRVSKRVTLYASANDRALQVSKKYQGDFQRAGDSAGGILILPGIDTIDVSAVDTNLVGHFYYGDNKSVLSDIFYLLKDGKAPGERFSLLEQTRENRRYWVFRP